MAAINDIELATLLPGAKLIIGQDNVEEAWLSDIYAESGPTIACLKVIKKNQLIAEVVCALIGIALNLNVPKPFLVHVDRNYLPDSKKWINGETQKICFGSEFVQSKSMKQLINLRPNLRNAISTAIFNWDGFKETAWFDEWIANSDRNSGNILWDGKTCWLIDHAHALTGPNWTPSDLSNGKRVSNKFLNADLVVRMNQVTKEEWKSLAGKESSRYQTVGVADLKDCGMMHEYATEEQIKAVINFLKNRAENFFKLACERLQLSPPLI